jgi:hypothetical protein
MLNVDVVNQNVTEDTRGQLSFKVFLNGRKQFDLDENQFGDLYAAAREIFGDISHDSAVPRENKFKLKLQTSKIKPDEATRRFLRALRSRLQETEPAHRPPDHDRLYFRLSVALGEIEMGERSIIPIFEELAARRPVGLDPLIYEDEVLRTVTDNDRFKSQITASAQERVRSWLASRLAVDRIRVLHPLPWIMRMDGIRMLVIGIMLLLGMVGINAFQFTPPRYHFLAERIAVLTALIIPLYVFIVTLAFRRFNPAIRPLSTMRVAGLLAVLVAFLFSDEAWRTGLSATPRLTGLIAALGLLITGIYWYRACQEVLGYGMGSAETIHRIRQRAKLLFVLHFEEALATVILLDAIVGSELSRSVREAIPITEFSVFGVLIPRAIDPNLHWLPITLHPTLILVWTPASMLLSTFSFLLTRSIRSY